MAAQSNIPSRLILKLPSSELKNILQLNETKNAIIKINDILHDNICSGYYAITEWSVDKEDDDQVVIYAHPLKGSNIVQLFSPKALDNPEYYTPIDSDPAPAA